ncbi:single-stranded DNA-binding protein [Microterricola viridarii]|uniref:Single-stranded DNA-binding protein n=1 Tax=Microterricola viridarii TaxID=412690 RepID=A0A109QYE0_9MICO|nr:single-stranded DNA-binding protein [Microterricola viridarii]AMB58260.1 hypothetical protein AWU67_04665 [Microterricola viridarii]
MRESNDIITVLGVIGTDPEAKVTSNGVPLIKFRMASTQRKFDKETNSWADGNTNWYTVSAFRGLARNAIASLHRGDPVVVTGRLHLRAWNTGERQGTSADLEADVIGLDLQWGTANFQRTMRAQPLETTQSAPAGDPGPTAALGADAQSGFDGFPASDAAQSPGAQSPGAQSSGLSVQHWPAPREDRAGELEPTPF